LVGSRHRVGLRITLIAFALLSFMVSTVTVFGGAAAPGGSR
jgi:hypothetical protein